MAATMPIAMTTGTARAEIVATHHCRAATAAKMPTMRTMSTPQTMRPIVRFLIVNLFCPMWRWRWLEVAGYGRDLRRALRLMVKGRAIWHPFDNKTNGRSHGVSPPPAPWLLGRSAVEDHRLSELISKLSPQF